MTTTSRAHPGCYFPFPVRYADTDAQTHAFLGNTFTHMDEAYMGYLEAIGFSCATLADMGLETY